MIAAHPTVERLRRRPDLAWLGGVAAGIAEHTGLRWRTVVLVFVVLTAAGGLGIALYAAYWIVLPAAEIGPPQRRLRLPKRLEYAGLAVLGLAAIAIVIWQGSGGGFFVPSLLAVIGGAFMWRQAVDRTPLSAEVSRLRLSFGVLLVIAGGALVLGRADFTAVRDGLLAMVVTLVGIALLSGPWWIRLVSQLGAERRERIRSQERADIAAHLHDSVLQTLALIQRNAESPREVVRLARGQERELRDLLYAERTTAGQLSDQLRADAAEIEDAYAVTVELVVVGDAALDPSLAAACAAAREATTNAAKHAEVAAVSLYAEVEEDAVSLFVRDRGVGFDPGSVAEDRQGVRGSIIGRVERYGGTATIRSTPGAGTEVMIRMPRT